MEYIPLLIAFSIGVIVGMPLGTLCDWLDDRVTEKLRRSASEQEE